MISHNSLQLCKMISEYIRMLSNHAQGILVLDSNTISTGFIVTVSYKVLLFKINLK
jgi:hypothetical protein